MKSIIVNAHVISPGVDLPDAAIEIKDGKIARVAKVAKPARGDWVFDAKGAYVVPGFIDVHLHGACGYDVCDATPEAIEKIAEAKIAEGCTSFLPTTLTVGHDNLIAAAKAVAAYRRNPTFSKVIGIHLEGPFINVKCCGAQNPKFVRKPDMKEVLSIDRISPVRQISFAPEQETFAEFMPAYRKGLRHMTHFCNQMTKLHHREIGMVGAGFLIEDLNTEVICDRIHLCDDMLRLVFARRSLEHIQMITDSLRCSHCRDGYAFEMGGLKVELKNGEARLVEGGNLAGSTLWMNQGLKNLRDVTGLPLKDLVRVTSWNQAIEQGLGDRLGKVEKGYVADLAVLDPKSFKVKAVFLDGERRI